MFQFLFDALDFWMDRPRKLKSWIYGMAFAAVIIGAAVVLDRCGPDRASETASAPASS